MHRRDLMVKGARSGMVRHASLEVERHLLLHRSWMPQPLMPQGSDTTQTAAASCAEADEVVAALAALLSSTGGMQQACLSPNLYLPQLRKEDIHQHVKALQLAQQRIDYAIKSRISVFQTSHNQHIPFHQLPAELVSQILSIAMEEEEPSNDNRWGLDLLHDLSSVCRRWWEVIKGTPSFWAVIDPHGCPPSIVRLKLRKSRGAPLHIRSPICMDRYTEEAVGAMLATERTRWAIVSLHARQCLESPHITAIQDILSEPMMGLRTLRVVADPDIACGTIDFSTLWNAPVLRELAFERCLPSNLGEVIRGLQVLEFSSIRSDQPLAGFILATATRCPLLRRLRIHDCHESNANPIEHTGIGKVYLSKLKALQLEWSDCSIYSLILRGVVAPNLDTLHVRHAQVDSFWEPLAHTECNSYNALSTVFNNTPTNALHVRLTMGSIAMCQQAGGRGLDLLLAGPGWAKPVVRSVLSPIRTPPNTPKIHLQLAFTGDEDPSLAIRGISIFPEVTSCDFAVSSFLGAAAFFHRLGCGWGTPWHNVRRIDIRCNYGLSYEPILLKTIREALAGWPANAALPPPDIFNSLGCKFNASNSIF